MRLDIFLVKYKNVESRTKAQDLIALGVVVLNDAGQIKVLNKSSFDVSENMYEMISIKDSDHLKYVSRAGLKLEGALKYLKLDVKNMQVLDIGQSTGGFTDCLLQKGASKIVGIDVGQGQLHPKLKDNTQVVSFENLNVKDISNHSEFIANIPENKFDLIVCDVSFISLLKVAQHVVDFLRAGGHFLFLVKPQFECGPENLDKNGIVKNESVYNSIQENVINHFTKIFNCHGQYFASDLIGKDGNREFFIYGQKK